MEEKTIVRLKKLCRKVHDLFILIDKHREKDPRYAEITNKLLSAEGQEATDKARKEYSAFINEIGIGEKAKKLQDKLVKEYGDLLAVKYYKPKYLSLIISALESGSAQTVEQAIEIAEKEM